MRSVSLPVSKGLNTRGGLSVKPGWLLKARNSRYLPGDTENRLWALLGRSVFGAIANPKAIFPYYIDGGASYLVAHSGDSLYEAPLGATGVFTLAKALGGTSSRGVPFSYLQNTYYPAGPNAANGFWTRQASGWVKGGHRTPTATFAVIPFGAGTFASTYTVLYTFRIYDNTTGTESAHAPFSLILPFFGLASVHLSFGAGVTTNGERGTHVRIYRSLLNEPAGKMYRIENENGGDGIKLADVVPGYVWTDSLDNVTALIYGNVQADGEEGSLSWAEYGGPPPQATGGRIFNDHAVLWGVKSDANATDAEQAGRVYYSAQGLPELYPVDSDGVYQYYLTFSTAKQDKVMLCREAGPYLLVFNQNSIFRVLSLPTYQDAGFSRKVQDVLTLDHGCCSKWGADSFGIGTEESSYCVYVSREHGPMLTNGVSDRPIMDAANWLGLVNRAALDQVVVRNYPTLQELWIFYPGVGSATNNQALIADYSAFSSRGAGVTYGSTDALGLRVTGPIDVQADDAFLGWCTDAERFYLASNGGSSVFVQDSGSVDAQLNTDANGGIKIQWQVPAVRLAGSMFRNASASRVGVGGFSGSAVVMAATVEIMDGIEDYGVTDVVQIGPGDTEDAANAAIAGTSHRLQLDYTGPTGSNYDPDSADCAFCLEEIAWEVGATGTQKRMSGV